MRMVSLKRNFDSHIPFFQKPHLKSNRRGILETILPENDALSKKGDYPFHIPNMNPAAKPAEGLQATIRYISENLDNWLELGWAYVFARITEIHGKA